MELDDDQVLVVTRVPDDGPAIAVTGHIHDTVDVRPQQQLVRVGRIVEGRIVHRPASIDRIEVVTRCSEVDGRVWIRKLQIQRRGVQRDVVVDELPDEREPGEQNRAGVQMVAVRHRLVLDHGLGQVRQQLVARRKRRHLLEHRPEPAFRQPVLARQVHSPELDTVQAGAAFRGMRRPRAPGRPARRPTPWPPSRRGTRAAKGAGRASSADAERSAGVIALCPQGIVEWALVGPASIDGEVTTRQIAGPRVEHGQGRELLHVRSTDPRGMAQ